MANELVAKIFRQEVRFIAGAAKPSQLPKMFLPQVAFVGKSNVGKSSLINTICRRKNLARVSHTPGRTRQINFFLIAEKLVIAPKNWFSDSSNIDASDIYLENWIKI